MKIVTFALIVLGLASSGGAQEFYAPPGVLVDLGGQRLHLYCTGRGSPTVVLDAGASSFSIDWALVQPQVAETNRVCSYDRPGSGWSDPAPFDLRGEEVPRALHAALEAEGEEPPYVLVGHSMGGRFVRLFQRAYPQDVVGMVLIDAEHEDGLFLGIAGRPVAISTLSDEEFNAAYPTPSSPPQVPEPTPQPAHALLPADMQPIRLWLARRLANAMRAARPEAMLASMRSEHAALNLLHQIDSAEPHPLNALPLVVLTRGLNCGPRWKAWQADLARLSTNSRQTIVSDSDHEIHQFRPDVVVQAIRDVAGPRSNAAPEQ
jgi:pimeloyl-ACP methyl ester carboxylesterase